MDKDSIKEIIDQLDIAHLPIEQQEMLADQAVQNLMQSVTVRAMTSLSEADTNELNARIAEGNMTATTVWEFFMAKVPDFSGLVAEEISTAKTNVDMILGRYNPEA